MNFAEVALEPPNEILCCLFYSSFYFSCVSPFPWTVNQKAKGSLPLPGKVPPSLKTILLSGILAPIHKAGRQQDHKDPYGSSPRVQRTTEPLWPPSDNTDRSLPSIG